MRNFLLYGLATGFNRLSAFVIIPLLSPLLSVDDFGDFTLYVIIVQFLIPLLSLNISSIIARETTDNWRATLSFVSVFNKVTLVFIMLLAIFILIERNITLEVILYAILEAVFLVNTTLIRFKSKVEYFFYTSLAKVCLLAAFIGITWYVEKSFLGNLHYLLIIFALANLVVAIPFFKIIFHTFLPLIKCINYLSSKKTLLIFSISLMPHIVAQWITSGSDRFIVKAFTGNVELGIYSFAYSVAAVFMLVNSSLALGMPQLCVNKHDLYSSKRFYKKYFTAVSLLWLVFVSFVAIASPYFPERYLFKESMPVFLLIAVGMYFLSFYYYYAAFIFYERKAKELSVITIKIAIINVAITVVLTFWLGIAGAAASTALSYLLYAYLSYREARKSKAVKNLILPLIFSISTTIAVIFYANFSYLHLLN
ncbi:oligosaccharide flippase family protein [Erwinia sp. P6884]|uniref:oligosaccharide flippase family protein n=1 Tax=Erwinia sp. P6884 TaxID=3141450 RepID=UPI0031901F95